MSTTIDEYIDAQPARVRTILKKVRKLIRETAPEAEEAIKYRIPTFVLNGNLVHFAAFADHLGFYPTPSGIKAFEAELSDYTYAKGSVQFPLDHPIPYDLIRRITAFRAAENRAKSKSRKKK
ncbi:MAG: DUF1801 domain-containing protein [Pirellulales bacterium]